ncbi:MAG TPA: 3-hydroxyacyl-CoA dehydrogenase, partial [Solirubrobacteraceae bacterium]|nr:3-hydroxyacyl-CoA dehydrogenase [Solirubrobacteraceae bacterium]
ERLLVVEALEAARCADEGVITSAAEANIGSLLGIGYPAWTGGVAQYIEGYPGGPAAFVARADHFAARYGERFAVPASVRERAAAAMSSSESADVLLDGYAS